MTAERRLILDLGDVRGFVRECVNCRTRVTAALERGDSDTPNHVCPACGVSWFFSGDPRPAFYKFVESMRELLRLQEKGEMPFLVRLEFDEPGPTRTP